MNDYIIKMERVSNGIYEYYEDSIKFECIRRPNNKYDLFVTIQNDRFRFSVQSSLKACEKEIKNFIHMHHYNMRKLRARD